LPILGSIQIYTVEEIAKHEEFCNFLHFEPLGIPFQGNQFKL